MAGILVPQMQYRWTLELEQCPGSGVGGLENNQNEHGAGRHNEDRWFNGSHLGMELCLVLDGHDGEKAADFARLHLPGQLLAQRLTGGPQAVFLAIGTAFKETEKQYFMALDDALTRKLSLQSEINSRARNSYEAQMMYPQQVKEIQRLENQIRGGTTAVLSLVLNNQLYIANVGDSRAVLCQNNQGTLTVMQLSDDHNVYNPGEQERLAKLGLDIDMIVSGGRLGPYQITRSIGDFDIKGGYKDVEMLSQAKEEPGVATPFINGPWAVNELRNSFLLLMSDGLYEAYGVYIDSGNPQEVHEGIASIVTEEMKTKSSIDKVAQGTVDRVKWLLKSQRPNAVLDDITLIVNNFNNPLHGGGVNEVDTPTNDRRVSGFGGENGGGEFVPEYDPSESELVHKLVSHGGPSKSDPLVFPAPVELNEEQKKTGKFIVPYILFPLSFPYDKGLDEF